MDGDLPETAPELAHRSDEDGDPELSRLAAKAYRSGPVDIEEALRRDWIEVWYQPQLDFRHGHLTGAEALARIRHPEHGVLLPRLFLPAASQASLARLTESTLRIVLADRLQFDAAGFLLQLSMNVPASVLLQRAVVERVGELVGDRRAALRQPPALILEVKQNEIVRDLEPLTRLAEELKPRAVHIAIDNFNGSYVSFSDCRELPFFQVKIDHRFVKNCARDPANAAVCRAAVAFAGRFGMICMADGIDNMADLLRLQQLGCERGQGVVIAPPLPPAGLIDLLQRWQTQVAAPPAAPDASAAAHDGHPGINRVA